MEVLNIRNIDTKPEDLARVIRKIKSGRDTLNVEDRKDKISVPVGFLITAASSGLNMQPDMILDGAGNPEHPPREHNSTYHTHETWKQLRLINVGTDPYSGITGAGIFHDQVVWDAAGLRSRLKGSLIQDAQRKTWEYMGEYVERIFAKGRPRMCAFGGYTEVVYRRSKYSLRKPR